MGLLHKHILNKNYHHLTLIHKHTHTHTHTHTQTHTHTHTHTHQKKVKEWKASFKNFSSKMAKENS